MSLSLSAPHVTTRVHITGEQVNTAASVITYFHKMYLQHMFEMPDEALVRLLGDKLNPAVSARVKYSEISRTVLNTRIELATDDQSLNNRRPSTSESSPNPLIGMVSRVASGVHIARPATPYETFPESG